MGIRIAGDNVMIFKNEKGGYSTGISNKLLDGTYQNAYIQVQFKKGIELENKTRINIKDGFLSFFKTQEGNVVYKIIILDFEQEGDAKEPETSYDNSNPLPF